MRQSVDMLSSAAVSVEMCVKWPFQLGARRQSGGGEALMGGKSPETNQYYTSC